VKAVSGRSRVVEELESRWDLSDEHENALFTVRAGEAMGIRLNFRF